MKFFIYDKDKPEYDKTLPFSLQSEEVKEYYKNEFKKIKEGFYLTPDIKLHGWLYWHINFWTIGLDIEKERVYPNGTKEKYIDRVLGRPQLRDNELYINHFLVRADKERKGIVFFGTRRFGKTGFISSFIYHQATTRKNSLNQILGGSAEDLLSIKNYVKEGYDNLHPFLKKKTVTKNWHKNLWELGYRDSTGEKHIYSTIQVINLDDGSGVASEKPAGGTPSGFVMDEVGKFPMKNAFSAAKYAFSTPYGWRVIPILLGTGGNVERARDIFSILEDVEIHGLLPMDWDVLDDWAGEHKTWVRRDFGIFVPAQMSLEPGLIKDETNLKDFFNLDDESLSQVKVYKTNWGHAKTVLEQKRLKLVKDPDELFKLKQYLPLKVEDVLVKSKFNYFPINTIRDVIERLKDKPLGKKVRLYRSGGRIKYELTDDELAPFPHRGGIFDAPVQLFEEPPETPIVNGTYVAGLDHYKQDKSGTSSLGALYIYKRELNLDKWSGRIVASYVARPNSMDIFNEVAEMLLELYGAECLMEGADLSFYYHMSAKGKDDIYLADASDMVKRFISPRAKINIPKGLPASTRNQEYIFKLITAYANKKIELTGSDENDKQVLLGVEQIPDIYLLREMEAYSDTGNYDRLIAFGHALAWARYLDSMNVVPEITYNKEKETVRVKKKKLFRPSFYTKPIKGFYR